MNLLQLGVLGSKKILGKNQNWVEIEPSSA